MHTCCIYELKNNIHPLGTMVDGDTASFPCRESSQRIQYCWSVAVDRIANVTNRYAVRAGAVRKWGWPVKVNNSGWYCVVERRELAYMPRTHAWCIASYLGTPCTTSVPAATWTHAFSHARGHSLLCRKYKLVGSCTVDYVVRVHLSHTDTGV